MQLIPIRRSSLILFIAASWLVWALLLAGHYLIHVREQSWSQLPIASLFHVRDRDSISQWLGTQLWMVTALMATMIYQLRRHKLDDYRATYRIWLLLVFAALVSSLDASSSALYRLGWSIDGWARAEIGYSGWAVVFVSFASLVAILALRMCTELKTVPLSVTFWLLGLLAWGFGAIIGTGLVRTQLPKAQLDMVVGGAWLGGILAVWMSAGVYLRHVYIQAQRRLMLREGLIRESRSLRLPSLRWSRRQSVSAETDPENLTSEANSTKVRGWMRLPFFRSADTEDSADTGTKSSDSQSTSSKKRRVREREADESSEPMPIVNPPARAKSDKIADEKNRAIDEESEPSAAQAERKAGWSSWLSRDTLAKNESTEANRPATNQKASSMPSREARAPLSISDPQPKSSTSADESPATKSSWWKRQSRPKDASAIDEKKSKPLLASAPKKSSDDEANKVSLKQRLAFWKRQGKSAASETKSIEPKQDKNNASKPSPGLGNWVAKRTDGVATATEKSKSGNAEKSDPIPKKSFWSKKAKAEPVAKAAVKQPEGTKKRLFGMFDGLKLKPPVEVGGSNKQSAPVPVSTSRALPTTSPNSADDDAGDDGDRNLTRAERRRLRREQEQNRRAA